jgi:hypothetical protein
MPFYGPSQRGREVERHYPPAQAGVIVDIRPASACASQETLMKVRHIVVAAMITVSGPAPADPTEARDRLLTLPHADVARLIGSWQVKEMEPIRMIYEFQPGTFAMHGKNDQGGSTFEMTLDADYRTAGKDAIWVIGTHPRPVPDGTDANNPSIIGLEFSAPDQLTMSVGAGERFTLVKVP